MDIYNNDTCFKINSGLRNPLYGSNYSDFFSLAFWVKIKCVVANK